MNEMFYTIGRSIQLLAILFGGGLLLGLIVIGFSIMFVLYLKAMKTYYHYGALKNVNKLLSLSERTLMFVRISFIIAWFVGYILFCIDVLTDFKFVP